MSPGRRQHHLAARPSASSKNSSHRPNAGDSSASPSSEAKYAGRAKRHLIESACSACRRRKSKCDGTRPACARCQSLHTECHYEAEEGESRWSALRRRNQILETDRTETRDLLMWWQSRTPNESDDLYRRFRQTPFDDFIAHLRVVQNGALPPGVNVTDPTLLESNSRENRLPPIRVIVDDVTASGSPRSANHRSLPSLLTPDASRGSSDSPHERPAAPAS